MLLPFHPPPLESLVNENIDRQGIHIGKEHDKFRHRPDHPRFVQETLDLHYLLLPATFDPGGVTGPLLSSFLWGPKISDYFSEENVEIKSRNQHSLQAETISRTALADYGLFPRADLAWKNTFGKEWFTSSSTSRKPSHWAKQFLGYNVTRAHAKHLYLNIIRLQKEQKRDSELDIGGLVPRRHPDSYMVSNGETLKRKR